MNARTAQQLESPVFGCTSTLNPPLAVQSQPMNALNWSGVCSSADHIDVGCGPIGARYGLLT